MQRGKMWSFGSPESNCLAILLHLWIIISVFCVPLSLLVVSLDNLEIGVQNTARTVLNIDIPLAVRWRQTLLLEQ